MTESIQLKIIDQVVRRESAVYDVVYFYGDHQSTQSVVNKIESVYKERFATSVIVRTTAAEIWQKKYLEIRNGIFYSPAPVCDLYILEHIEEIAGREVIEQHLYGVLDSLLESGKQIIITGSEPAMNLLTLAPRIRAQIDGGLALSVDAETVN